MDLVHLAKSRFTHLILHVFVLGVLVLLVNQSGYTIEDQSPVVTLIDVDDFAFVRYVKKMFLIDHHL